MNSTNLQPLVQDSFHGFHEYDAHKDAEELIETCSSADLAAGFLLLPSGMPSFVQDGAAEIKVKDVDFGTTRKPFMRKIEHYSIHGKVKHFYDGEFLCPCCRNKLVNNGTTDIEPNHTPYNGGHCSLIVRRPSL